MNRDLRTLEQQLESATARDAPPNALPDQETASLREAWLAFGQLLETAQPSSDQPIGLLRDPPARRSRRWLLAAIVGLAASLLAAATIAWSARRIEPAAIATAPSVDIAANHVEPSPPAVKQLALAGRHSAPAWDDALDGEITLAGQAVVSANQDWTLVAGACSPVRYGLEEVEKDIENSPL